jgi:hypothetical protein
VISLTVVFTLFVIVFAVIGAMRGWVKELLVTSAIILGLFINAILENYIEPYRAAILFQPGGTQFLMRGVLVLLLAIFGYQTPRLRALEGKVAKERLQDMLLGMILGALNGYLLLGTLWYYLHQAGYPYDLIIRPEPGSDLDVQIANLVPWLPPGLLPIPHVYFAVGIVFVFVIVVFV